MQPGQILVADHDGTYVIKFLGDVRLTLCLSFDKFINDMLSADDFTAIWLDLTEAEAVDSTTLGLMAKISIFARERRGTTPVVVSTNPSINRILESMGFDDILEIVHSSDAPILAAKALEACVGDEDEMKAKVLEAHHLLIDINSKNQATFQDLIESLER